MIGRILASCIVALGAVTGAQVPEFAQQYRQRLGGAVDELKMSVLRFDADASAQGLTRGQALDRHRANADDLFKKRGQAMEETILRHDRLDRQLREMTHDSTLVRLTSFFGRADADLARATLSAYEPAMPVTAEGGILAAIGALFGWWFWRIVTWPKRSFDRRVALWRAYRR